MERSKLVSQLQSLGEDAIGKLAQSPATRGAVHNAKQVRERGGRVLRTLESIEERLAAIEARLGAIEAARSADTPVRTRAPRSGAATKAKTGA